MKSRIKACSSNGIYSSFTPGCPKLTDMVGACVDLKATIRQSAIERLLELSVPALIAVAGFLSWIMLINCLEIPYWLYYERTIYLIYLGRSLDPIAWLLSSVLALVLLAWIGKGRSSWLWPGILLLWLGIALGTLGLAGLGRLGIVAGSLLTLIGLVVGANAVFKELASTSRGYFLAASLLVLSLLILPAELGSLSYYVLSAFHPGTQVGMSWELLELQLWYTAFPLVPFLYVAFLFSWIWAPLFGKIIQRQLHQPVNSAGANAKAAKSRAWLFAIGGYILLSVILGYYAYSRDATYPLVGTDIYWRNALPAQRVLASTSWIAAAAKERHPVVVLGIAILSNLSGLSVEPLLRFAYVGLILAFGATVFLLVFLTSGNKTLAAFAALLSTVSPPTTEGIYTGIIASWVAMIIWVLSLACLARIKGHRLRGYFIPTIGLCFGSLAVLFIHPWTWAAMMVALLAFPIAAIASRLRDVVRDLRSILVVILLNAIVLALSFLVLPQAQGWREADAFSLVRYALRTKYFGLGSWQIIVFFSQIWSQFLNPVILSLSILGVLVLVLRRDRLSVVVLGWLVAACATNLLAAPMGYNPTAIGRGETQIFRALFLTPFQVPSAAGFLFLGSTLQSRLTGVGDRASKIVTWIVLGVIFLAMTNGALRALFPLLTDPHIYPQPWKP